MKKKPMPVLLEREQIYLKPARGGGILSYEVWGYHQHGRAVVTRYNLAYINPAMFAGDNGRVLGYDNAHGYHHRHKLGVIEAVTFSSYEDQLVRFQQEWHQLANTLRRK